jgi:beta-phosphoglucomutase-like phosphatase (HAD superfamily)
MLLPNRASCRHILDVHPDECAFVGDSTSGMLVGRLASVPVIGHADKPGKAELLTQAGADTVTTGLDEITRALRLTPVDGSLRPGLTPVSAAVACP